MIQSRLKVLLADKSLREGRRLPYRTVAKETGVSASTLSRMAEGKMTRFNAETLSALCRYLECDVGDLLSYQAKQGVPDMN